MASVNPWLMVFRHLPSVPLYSVVVNIMQFYRHDRDSNPDRCGENQNMLTTTLQTHKFGSPQVPLSYTQICTPYAFWFTS